MPDSPPMPRGSSADRVAAEIAWIAGQAGAIAIFAAGIRPTSGYPQPVEATADLALACVQLVLASLLSPPLMKDWRSTVRTLAVAVVFAMFASRLTDRPAGVTAKLMGLNGLWLIALGRVARMPAGRLVAVFLTVGLPVAFYARLEYGRSSIGLGDWPTLLSPTLGVCTIGLHNALWPAVFVPAMVLTVALAANFRRRAAGSLHSGPLQ